MAQSITIFAYNDGSGTPTPIAMPRGGVITGLNVNVRGNTQGDVSYTYVGSAKTAPIGLATGFGLLYFALLKVSDIGLVDSIQLNAPIDEGTVLYFSTSGACDGYCLLVLQVK